MKIPRKVSAAAALPGADRPPFRISAMDEEQLQSLLQLQADLLRPLVWNQEGIRILAQIGRGCSARRGILLRRELKAPGARFTIEGAWNHPFHPGSTIDLTECAGWQEFVRKGQAEGPDLQRRLELDENGRIFLLMNEDEVSGVLGIEIDPAGRRQGRQVEEFLRAATEAVGAALSRSIYFRVVRDSRDRLQQTRVMQAIGQMTGGIAHEFNNVLTIIQGYSEILVKALPEERAHRHMAREIVTASVRAAALAGKLGMLRKSARPKTERIDLTRFLRNVDSLLSPLLSGGIDLQVRTPERALFLEVDRPGLQQVIASLAQNAREAMPDGGRLSISLRQQRFRSRAEGLPRDRLPGEYACLSVADTGRGIPAEIRPRIFDPFFTTRTLAEAGGLGLALVYGILDQHQGWIEVESNPGEGTSFHLYFPISPAEGAAPAEAQKSSAPPASLTTPASETEHAVLLVDDEKAVREMAMRVLRPLGYGVVGAANGPEALRVWAREKDHIRLLVTDLVMPMGMSGVDLAERLRQEKPDLKVIFLSGHSDEMHRIKCREGETSFLAKPFSVQALAEKVHSYMSSGQ